MHVRLVDRATGLDIAGAHAQSEFELVAEAEVTERYHQWYMDGGVPETVRWLGVPTMKSALDMWNYQEIIFRLRPRLVVEFGTFRGGSALYFATVLEQTHAALSAVAVAAGGGGGGGSVFRVLTVDVERGRIDPRVLADRRIEVMTASSVAVLPRTCRTC